MRAGIYVRISRDIAGQGLGVQRQEEDCRSLAKALGWEVADLYVDNDVSATSGKARPEYQRMLADLQAGDIAGIVAWHADRLYRKIPDLMGLMEVVKSTNAQIATCQSSTIDLSTPTGRMLATILASVATQEVEHKSERWSRSWQQGRERGAPVTNSSRLFGYARDGVTVIESEAVIARRMLADLLAGMSMDGITRWLHAEGIQTTRGGIWRTAGIRWYLKNPRIAGYSTLKGEIVGEGQWEPIVDREDWEAGRALLNSRTRAYVPRKNILTGILYCGRCGTRMISSKSRDQRNYRCPSRPVMGGCGGTTVLVEHAERVVEAYARKRLDDPEARAQIASIAASPSGAQAELAGIDARITELERQLDEPGVPVATILRAIERAKTRQEELMDQIAATPRTPLPAASGPWPKDLRRRRALVDLVVERIDVLPVEKMRGRNAFIPERIKITPR